MFQQPSDLKEGYADGAPTTTFANAQNLLLPMAAFICILISFLVWILYRHLKQQSEWQQASELQLKQISQRNNIQPEQVVEERKTKFTDTQTNVVPLKSTHTSATIINSCKGTSDPVLDNEQVQRIREQQQKHHETKTKLAKQLKRQAEKEKKRMLYDSLQHQVADEAHARRKKLISEEQARLLDNNTSNPQQSSLWEPQPRNELEEMERRELLYMQNVEYEESLRRDQERSMRAEIEADKRLKRARAIQLAMHRLENAGVNTTDLPIVQQKDTTAETNNDDDNIQVRLALPTGKRVHAIYSKHHSVGLIHDLVLLILNYNQQDEDVSTLVDAAGSLSEEHKNRDEWKELFDIFTIKTTYPPKTFDELDLTLEQVGFVHNVMLMVILESP
jgi:predicted metal-binding transcription factor (methanogenesis marker protein 9)